MQAYTDTHVQMHIHTCTLSTHAREKGKKEQFLAFPNRSESPKPVSSSFPSLPLPTPNTGQWRRHPTSATCWQCILEEGTMSSRLFHHPPNKNNPDPSLGDCKAQNIKGIQTRQFRADPRACGFKATSQLKLGMEWGWTGI